MCIDESYLFFSRECHLFVTLPYQSKYSFLTSKKKKKTVDHVYALVEKELAGEGGGLGIDCVTTDKLRRPKLPTAVPLTASSNKALPR